MNVVLFFLEEELRSPNEKCNKNISMLLEKKKKKTLYLPDLQFACPQWKKPAVAILGEGI